MAELTLELHAVGHRYGQTPVVHGVDLQLLPGEIVAFLGASGCGKTTLLRAIAGLVLPLDGRIVLQGQVVADQGRELVPIEKRGIGLVFQDYALFPSLTVAANIGYGLRGNPERVNELLVRVGLDGLGGRFPAELSGGQQQRVALARALAPRPHLLLLDEPFANVDANRRAELGASLRETLAAEGRAAILVTHDRNDALGLADRVLVLVPGPKGAVVGQLGTPEEVYGTPSSTVVARLTGPCALLPATADGVRIQTALGDLESGRVAGPGVLVVRPEQLTIEAEGPHRVLHSRFLGDHVAHWIQGPAGPIEANANIRMTDEVGLTLLGGHFLPT